MPKTLLDWDAVGGTVARRGFEYQDAFALQQLPHWLQQEAFSHVVSEGTSDVEVCYFAGPGHFKRHAFEAKGYELTMPQLWEEVHQFHDIWKSAPDEFERFGLVCTEYGGKAKTLRNMLVRLRGVGSSFSRSSSVTDGTRDKIRHWMVKNGQTGELADFVIERVEFVQFSGANAEATFQGSLAKHPALHDLTHRQSTALADEFRKRFLTAHLGPVYRVNLERAIAEVVGASDTSWRRHPSRLTLSSTAPALDELGLDVSAFMAPTVNLRREADWANASHQLNAIREFLLASRDRRLVALTGQLRMSLACFLGAHLRATQGLHLQVEHRGEMYETGNHGVATAPMFLCSGSLNAGSAAEGVLIVEVATPPAGPDVDDYQGGALKGLVRRTLSRSLPLATSQEFHWAADEIKNSLVELRSRLRLERVHLFLKGPSVLSIFLGHRLNSVGRVQLYDWVDGRYVATVELRD